MKQYVYKRYYLVCGKHYFKGTYTYQGELYACWTDDKFNAKQYRIFNAAKSMKEKLDKKLIQGDHEDRNVEIETIEKLSY